jgi:hypothetical protein
VVVWAGEWVECTKKPEYLFRDKKDARSGVFFGIKKLHPLLVFSQKMIEVFGLYVIFGKIWNICQSAPIYVE